MRYYYIYIITNKYKSVFYVGVTNSLKRRLLEHWSGNIPGFSSRYKCKYLIHYEKFHNTNLAIKREKEVKKWSKQKKKRLIEVNNPGYKFLNEHVTKVAEKYL
jgi:putative endonuclease